MTKHDHPVWFIITMAVMSLFLIALSWLNASTFDETEWKMISAMIAAMTGYFGLKGWYQSRAEGKEDVAQFKVDLAKARQKNRDDDKDE